MRHLNLVPQWLRRYPRRHLSTDVLAGFVVMVLVIPQSLAYALLAGLPPQAGLYASVLPVLAYAWLGSSMTQAVGPVAVTAIMTFAVLSPLAEPATAAYIELAAGLSVLTGLFFFVFGALRLGALAQLLSRPVVSAFITAAAVLIVLSQIKYFLGVTSTGATTWKLLTALHRDLQLANPVAMAIGLVSFVALYSSKRWLADGLEASGLARGWAQSLARMAPLVVVLGATVLVVALDLDRNWQVQVVGSVVGGLPWGPIWTPTLESVQTLFVPALLVAFMGMVQGITMAQALAIKRRERIDPGQELVGLGAANLAAAFSGGMPVGGGVSRTAVNLAAGAQSPLASVVAALGMWVILLTNTAWFARMPLAVLAASIVLAAISMVDIQTFKRVWAYDRADGLSWVCTVAGVLVLGLTWGIALGVLCSLATLVVRSGKPHMAVVGRIAGTEHFRNVQRHGVEQVPGVLMLRVDESLNFTNLMAVESRINHELERAPDTRHLVLLMSAVNHVDATGIEGLCELHQTLGIRGIELHLAEVKGPVQDRLAASDLLSALSRRIHLSAHAAFVALRSDEGRNVRSFKAT